MSTYPTSPRSAFLEWCQAHAPVFVSKAAQIGLTPAQATAFNEAVDGAAAALIEHEQAQQTAKAVTQTTDAIFNTLRTSAGDTVRTIRAFAENAADPLTVYTTAQIPPPATPTPAPPPAQPTDLTVTLDATMGALTLRWKASNPPGTSGTSYIIKRRLPGESAFAFIGVSGKKSFVDESLVAGPDSVQYTVQGQRGNSSGPVSPIFTVSFGQLPDGVRTARVTAGASNGAPTSDQALIDAIVSSQPHANGRTDRAARR